MFLWVLARSCFSVMEICLAESGTYASGSMFLGRWGTVKAQPKKAARQISLAFEEHGWQDLQRSPLHRQRNSPGWLVAVRDICVPGLHISSVCVDAGLKADAVGICRIRRNR